MKKLIPALCMLLVATALLGTSTYAWFSMNTQVKATGMQVKAVTNANLYIEEGLIGDPSSITGDEVTMGSTLHSLKPADLVADSGTVSVNIPDEYTTKPTVSTAGTAKTWTTKGTFTKTTATTALNSTDTDGIGNYIAGETMTLVRKAETNSGTYDVDAKVTVTLTGTSNLNKAIYCGFLVGDKFTQKAADTPAASGSVTFTFNDLIDGATDNAVQQVTFVFWYEGEDGNCTANNAIAISTNSVAITFTSRDHT